MKINTKIFSRFMLILIALFLGLLCFGQCESCPVGTPVTLTSSYSGTASYLWFCSDGYTSNDQSPTITPAEDVTCYVVITENECTKLDTVTVSVCDCPPNNPCVSVNYNPTLSNIIVSATGTSNSPVATDQIHWRYTNPLSAWTSIPSVPYALAGCTLRDYVDPDIQVQVILGGDFKLRLTNLTNKCGTPCTMVVNWVFPNTAFNSSQTMNCGVSTFVEKSISPANFTLAGNSVDAFITYTTSFGTAINQYRFTYNGGGWDVNNIARSTVIERQIFKQLEFRRMVTYSDGCDPVTCYVPFTIPNQPPGPCTPFSGFITSATLGSPCSALGLTATAYNGTGAVTYQWKYNGSNISGQTASTLCMTGRPAGNYCVVMTDSGGCVYEACYLVEQSCTVAVTISRSTTILQANVTSCNNPTFQWARAINGIWTNISGATNYNYNTAGVEGFYRVTVTCGSCTAVAYDQYLLPCNASVTLTHMTTFARINVTGCNGVGISYDWEFFDGSNWTTVDSDYTTATTLDFGYVGEGLYRIVVGCSNCTDEAQYFYDAPDLCLTYSATINGSNAFCSGSSSTYSVTPTGGVGPYTYEWFVNNVSVGTASTYNFVPALNGAFTITVTVEDSNGCTFTASKIVLISTCCSLTATLTPQTQSQCVGSTFAISANYANNTGSVNFYWSSSHNGGPTVNQGTGQTKFFTASSVGTTIITVLVVDAAGCQFTVTASVTTTTCLNCTCTASLSINGQCGLVGLFSGVGCSNYQYQLQYSATGTGWATVSSGVGSNGGGFTYAADANGLYRLIATSQLCQAIETPIVSVSCFSDCTCSPGVITNTGCQLTWNPNHCNGWVATLQKVILGTWYSVTTTSPYTIPTDVLTFPYLALQSSTYRLVYQKANCTDVYSAELPVTNATIVDVTKNHWDYLFDIFGVPDHEWEPCLNVGEKELYGYNPGPGNVISPNFYTETFTSLIPVTWSVSYIPTGPSANVTVLAQTSTTLVLRFQWVGGASTTNSICAPFTSGPGRYKMLVTATDACGRLVYKSYLFGQNIG